MDLHICQPVTSNARSDHLLQSSKTNLKLPEHNTKPSISSPNKHQWMGRTRHPPVVSHSHGTPSQRLSSISGEVVCSSKLNHLSWSWTELLRVQHCSVFLCQLDNAMESVFPEFAVDTKWGEEGGRRDRWATIQRALDSLHDQAKKNCRNLSRGKSCTHNAIMPSSSSTGCSITVL